MPLQEKPEAIEKERSSLNTSNSISQVLPPQQEQKTQTQSQIRDKHPSEGEEEIELAAKQPEEKSFQNFQIPMT